MGQRSPGRERRQARGETPLEALARQSPGGFVLKGGEVRPMTPAERREIMRSRPRRRCRVDPNWRRIWLGDWRRVLVENAAHAGPAHELIVITAPGADALPWDRSLCTHPPDVNCSGKLGCVVDRAAAAEWNRTAQGRHDVDGEKVDGRWTQLHRAAAQRARRRFGRFTITERAWEPQARGVLHMNVVVPTGTARERAAVTLYRRSLEELAPRYGFGFVSRKRRRITGLHAGRYIAKYLSEGGGKLGIGDLAARDDAPRVIALVNRKLTQQTGSTIRACGERRAVWNLASRLAPISRDGCSLEEAAAVRREIKQCRWYAKMAAMGARRRAREDEAKGLNELQVIAQADVRWGELRSLLQHQRDEHLLDDLTFAIKELFDATVIG